MAVTMLGIKTKLLIAFLVMSVIPFMAIGIISVVNSEQALREQAFGQLESIREVKKAQIEYFFAEQRKDMDVLMETVACLKQAAFSKLSSVQENKKAEIDGYFRKSMSDIAVISKNASVRHALVDFESTRDAAGRFDAELYRFFETVKHGDSLKQFTREYGYEDLLLINKSGTVVYTLNREADLGENVRTGALKNTGVGRCFQGGVRAASIQDFSPYPPSDQRFMAFLGSPIADTDGQVMGVLVLKLTNKALNTIVQRRQGMGRTAETYLVGSMGGITSYRSDRVVKTGSIGEERSGPHIDRAINGSFGPIIKIGSTGNLEIAKYDKLQIPGLDWILVTTMGLEEAIAPRLESSGQDYFSQYIQANGYSNLFLITADGDVFYSTGNRENYHSNLLTGKIADSGLGRLFQKVSASRAFEFIDFGPCEPAGSEICAFLGQPVVTHESIELIVALQLPIDPINGIMTERTDMGRTGETYLVGPDRLMRSDSFLDPVNYSVYASFADPMNRQVNTLAIMEALAGKTDHKIIVDYRGKAVLSAYTPLQMRDTTWALVAEMDTEEALAPVSALKKWAVAIGVVSISAIVLISLFMARHLSRPIAELTAAARQLRARNFDITVDVKSHDELAVLADTFNAMVIEIRNYANNLEQKVALLKKAEADLRQSEKGLRQLADATWEAIIIHDQGITIQVNDQFVDMFGYTRRELIGNNMIPLIISPESTDFLTRQIRAGKLGPYEFMGRHKNGREKPMEVRVRMMDYRGRRIRVAAIRDMTAQKMAEEEKMNLEAQLRQAHKMEAIGTLAGGIAHDFNNILAAILGYSEMARDDIPDWSPAKYQLEEVLKAGNRAKELVKHILSFSRKSEKTRTTVHIHLIVQEALKLLRASIPATIDIQPQIDTTCGHIKADPTQIHQVVMNLCTNAAQAMDESGGILSVTLNRVTVTPSEQENTPELTPGAYVRLEIRDTGMGIEPDIQERIFDPYFTTKDVGKGSGMGLAVVHGIVQTHDGMITLESRPGQGTAFIIHFPSVEAQERREAKNHQHIPGGSEHILVVDDEKSISKLLEKQLTRLGYQVTAQTSSATALEWLESSPNRFDLIVTDQTMPQVTGEQLARRAMTLRPGIPVILCSGYSSKMDAEKAAAMGISAFIMKPVNIGELARSIRALLDKNQ